MYVWVCTLHGDTTSVYVTLSSRIFATFFQFEKRRNRRKKRWKKKRIRRTGPFFYIQLCIPSSRYTHTHTHTPIYSQIPDTGPTTTITCPALYQHQQQAPSRSGHDPVFAARHQNQTNDDDENGPTRRNKDRIVGKPVSSIATTTA